MGKIRDDILECRFVSQVLASSPQDAGLREWHLIKGDPST